MEGDVKTGLKVLVLRDGRPLHAGLEDTVEATARDRRESIIIITQEG